MRKVIILGKEFIHSFKEVEGHIANIFFLEINLTSLLNKDIALYHFFTSTEKLKGLTFDLISDYFDGKVYKNVRVWNQSRLNKENSLEVFLLFIGAFDGIESKEIEFEF